MNNAFLLYSHILKGTFFNSFSDYYHIFTKLSFDFSTLEI